MYIGSIKINNVFACYGIWFYDINKYLPRKCIDSNLTHPINAYWCDEIPAMKNCTKSKSLNWIFFAIWKWTYLSVENVRNLFDENESNLLWKLYLAHLNLDSLVVDTLCRRNSGRLQRSLCVDRWHCLMSRQLHCCSFDPMCPNDRWLQVEWLGLYRCVTPNLCWTGTHKHRHDYKLIEYHEPAK